MTVRGPVAFILAGGTGGHVYPALAVALNLRDRGFRPHWVGTRRGLESRVVPAADIPLHCLPMRGLRGKGPLQQLVAMMLLALSMLASLWLMLRYRPALVIGMGGYASFPAAVAAWVVRRPLLLQEQNAVAGSANRALARFAGVIATGFPGVLGQYPAARYLGNPVREDLVAVGRERPWQWAGERALQVLVLGGSLGARPLNEAVPAVAGALGDRCRWRHQCGSAHVDATKAAYAQAACDSPDESAIEAVIEPFIENMAEAYAWADLVICRAGALTVAELAATGRPAILIPLPHAIDDHQSANARFLVDAAAARLLPQAEIQRLGGLLTKLLDDRDALSAMHVAALGCARPEATRMIADAAVELTL
jgi:UDP-N-acetylglucosamine--N-acetylmuramyl-(pentapeptide) pyrophosphoryl-undecaprenol N-acetylglucosamine transferase